MSRRVISEGSEWTFDLIRRYEQEIGWLAEEFGLDTYPNQIEIISSEQMMDAYAASGMPLYYHHWSFGKHFLNLENHYRRGQMGLAYEIVINSNPCIAYLLEENTMMMQALVIAHAAFGHNSFFKGNYLFRTWTEADSIIDYLLFARDYISRCEHRYGVDEVEQLLDSCHALMNYGVDRYKRPPPISAEEEQRRQREREEYLQKQVNDLWRTIPDSSTGRPPHPERTHRHARNEERFLEEPQENLLYFLEKHAPLLEPWQREIIRIVRKIAQYFYPQRQTQVMNEGWATFWHYTLLNELYDRGKVTDGFMLEFLQSHTSVIAQPSFDSPGYSGLNPYALGFAMMRDLRRICEAPTEEDREWFPDIAGSPWQETLQFAMRNFKDESFILQFLSPKVMRDLRLFSVLDDDRRPDILIAAIHDDAGYRHLREQLAAQYNLSDREPNIQITDIDMRGDRAMYLQHIQQQRRPLDPQVEQVLAHLHNLWGFDVHLDSLHEGQAQARYQYPSLAGL